MHSETKTYQLFWNLEDDKVFTSLHIKPGLQPVVGETTAAARV